MKRMLCMVMCILLLAAMLPAVQAATEPIITRQPQNARFPLGSVASYVVEAYGDNLTCTWYMDYAGTTYNLSDTENDQPWMDSVSDGFGPSTTIDGYGNHIFIYTFSGIGQEMDGGEIYAVVEDGHYQVESDRAYISLGGSAMPPVINVPAAMTVKQGSYLELCCFVKQEGNLNYDYLWYETGTGNLQDIMVIGGRTGEEQTTHLLQVDTSEVGTRYYVCAVEASNGGSAYSSVIAVTVEPGDPVLFTADSSPVPGGKLTVDIEAMTDYDARIWNAFLEKDVKYTWYQDGAAFVDRNSKTFKIGEGDVGSEIYVEVTCYDLTLTSEVFHITEPVEEGIFPDILTKTLPDAVVGESYSIKLECADPDAEFGIWYNPGKANDFEKTGLTLNRNGEIKGVPKAAGTYGFCVTTSNDAGEGYMAYTLTVKEPAPPATTAPVETAVPTEITPPVETTAPVETTVPVEATEPVAPSEPVSEPDKGPSPLPVILGVVGGAGVGGGAVAFFVLRKKRG